MNYKDLFIEEYLSSLDQFNGDIEKIVKQCKTLFMHEWIEEKDMDFYKNNAFSMSIEDILRNMPQLDWYKIAYETLKRHTGACCHLTAVLAGILSYHCVPNRIVIGSYLLTKGKYIGKHGIHYWNRVMLENSLLNIDLCSDTPLFCEYELRARNIICYKEISIES